MNADDVEAILSSMSTQSLDDLGQNKEDLAKSQRLVLRKIQEATADFQAEAFLEHLEVFVRRGIARRLDLEKSSPGPYEDPGWRQHYLGTWSGWISIYEIETEFIRRSNDNTIEVPAWVEKVIDKAASQGLELVVKKTVSVEVGVGNHAMADLCIRDPRKQESSAVAC